MEKNRKTDKSPEFFAAANGYDGFRSYFPEIFNSLNFERIFILKGGPGTGKSSFMRRLCSFAADNEYYYERILCSSDPHSLDGVILEKDGKRFAVIDGTAPHTRDANIPGAVDELINLGENWSNQDLIKNRRLITELNEKKKLNYASAYQELAHAGAIIEVKRKIEERIISYNILKSESKTKAEAIIKNERHGKEHVRLISSFGRFGKFHLDTPSLLASEIINVKSQGTASSLYMNFLARELHLGGIEMTVFPDVFDKNNIEAMFLSESKTAIVFTDSEKADIYPAEFVKKDPNINISSEFDTLHDSLMKEAEKFFTFASDLHFELEKIYIASMDFGKNDEFYEKTINEIKNLSL